MFKFFKKDPAKKLQSDYEEKLRNAMQAQRNGDMRTFSTLSEEASKILEEINDLKRS